MEPDEVDHAALGYAALNCAIAHLMAAAAEKGYTALDAVLVVGAQRLDEEGDRLGGVGVFMKDGVGPAYTAKGLLTDALDTLSAGRPLVCGCTHGS